MTRAYNTATTQQNTGGAVPTFVAGKNAIINGDFRINQRAFSTNTTSGNYTFDRWQSLFSGGTVTYSAQTFTAGAAPVAGYEGTNFIRIVTSGQSSGHYAIINQHIEDVRTYAGQTVTVSFWAKAASGTPKMFVLFRQNFGSGGSASADSTSAQVTLSTSWVRYSATVSIASISGKTIGTSSSLQAQFVVSDGNGSLGAQNGTFDIWGCQVESGNTATSFQTATGTFQGELAACQRYYQRYGGTNYMAMGMGVYVATTVCRVFFGMPVQMRVAPTLSNSTASNFGIFSGSGNDTASAISANSLDTTSAALDVTVTARTLGQAGMMNTMTNPSAFIAFSSEL